jgi:hypothetical protein
LVVSTQKPKTKKQSHPDVAQMSAKQRATLMQQLQELEAAEAAKAAKAAKASKPKGKGKGKA